MVTVKVPGTTSNLGPGFDTLGLALSLYSTFDFEKKDNGLVITGCDKKYANDENLIYTSLLKGLEHIGKKIHGLSINIHADVPVSRGLGSSSTCVVAGVLAAYALTDTKIDMEDVFTICTDIEGHPDNVSPALFGGLTASCTINEKSYYTRYDIDERFNFMALIPDFETSTHEARKVLPAQLAFKDVIYSTSRLATILKSFEKYDKKMLSLAMDDKIHEPYRKKLIHEYEDVKNICKEIDSVCFFISGSGSTLMNVYEDRKSIALIEDKLKSLKYNWKIRTLRPETKGAQIIVR